MRRFLSLFLAVVLSVLALGASSPADAAPLSERARLKLFEEVWRLVDREYFDPAFGGND